MATVHPTAPAEAQLSESTSGGEMADGETP